MNIANKVISDYVHDCICTILINVISSKFLPKIIEEFNSKNPSVRTKCAEYLLIILTNYPISILEKNESVIEN